MNPASPLPVPATPRLWVGATRPLPAAAGPAAAGGWAGAAGSAESAEIENRRRSRRTEASEAEAQLVDTAAPSLGPGACRPACTPPAPGVSPAWGCKAGRRAEARRAALCARPGPGEAGRARSPGLSEPPRRAELRAAHRAHLAGRQLPEPLRSSPKHHARRPEPVS